MKSRWGTDADAHEGRILFSEVEVVTTGVMLVSAVGVTSFAYYFC